MKTDKQEKWAITLLNSPLTERFIMLDTISGSRSDAISKCLDFWTGIGKECKSRDARWRAFKAHRDQFRAEKIIIHVAADETDEPKEKPKRCCDNCIDLMPYDSGKAIKCREENIPSNAGVVDIYSFICDKHRFYHEVYPNG